MDFLKEVGKGLDLPLAEKNQVMKELESHYSELREEFVASGMSESQAEEETARRLGDPVDVAQKMQSVHCRLGWRTAFIMALPVIALQCIRLLDRFLILLFSARGPMGLTSGVALGQLGEEHLNVLRSTTLATSAVALVIAGIFLYPSIRDWQAGRRPVWLATWMAGGVSALLMSAHSAFRAHYFLRPSVVMDQVPVIWLSLLPLLVWGGLATWLLKDLPRWRWFAAGTAMVGILVLLGGQLLGSRPVSYAMFLLTPMVLVAAGIGTFGRRPYGNAAQASLFLWVSGGMVYVGTPFGRAFWLLAISYAISTIVPIAAVFGYARQTSWSRKTRVIAAAMSVVALANIAPMYHDVRFVIQPAILLIWSMLFVVVAPALYGMRQSRQRPETV